MSENTDGLEGRMSKKVLLNGVPHVCGLVFLIFITAACDQINLYQKMTACN